MNERPPTVLECLQQIVLTESAILDEHEKIAAENPKQWNEIEKWEWRLSVWRARLELAREMEKSTREGP